MAVWHCREKEIEYGSKVLLMGIVNVTPDSFSDGGDWLDPATALTHARALEAQGADILDIGGQSTRPGHTPVTDKEEWARLEPVLSVLCKETALPVSVDTYYPYVAVQALRCGAQIINDVSGVVNPEMAEPEFAPDVLRVMVQFFFIAPLRHFGKNALQLLIRLLLGRGYFLASVFPLDGALPVQRQLALLCALDCVLNIC